MRERHLQLCVPALFAALPDERAATPANIAPVLEGLALGGLELALSRADYRPCALADDALDTFIFSRFGVAKEDGRDWPSGAARYALELGRSPREWVMCVDPVYLHADRAELNLRDPATLELNRDEAEALVAELNAHLSDRGYRFEIGAPRHWYLRLDDDPGICTRALSEVVHRPIKDALPSGRAASAWHAFLNEVQMILHACAVNDARSQRGELPINSVWVWGVGRLPALDRVGYTRVWTQNTVAAALAHLAGVEVHEVPDAAADWLDVPLDGSHLIIVDTCHGASRAQDVSAWREAVQTLEHRFVAPLLDALRDNTLQSLSLRGDRRGGFYLSRRALGRFWRRRRSFASIIAERRKEGAT